MATPGSRTIQPSIASQGINTGRWASLKPPPPPHLGRLSWAMQDLLHESPSMKNTSRYRPLYPDTRGPDVIR